MSIAVNRLNEERRMWRKDHPLGFWTKPKKNPNDDSTNIMCWEFGIPGKENTDYAGGVFTGELRFPEDYPAAGPKAYFKPVLFHCNVFLNGGICIDILNASWHPSISIKQILLSLQNLLSEPNPDHVTDQPECSKLYKSNRSAYDKEIREQTARFVPDV